MDKGILDWHEWVGIAMGNLCNYAFGWPMWVGLVAFSSACAVYVLAAGNWGVVMADFQQGIIAFLMMLIVSVWGMTAAGGPIAGEHGSFSQVLCDVTAYGLVGGRSAAR